MMSLNIAELSLVSLPINGVVGSTDITSTTANAAQVVPSTATTPFDMTRYVQPAPVTLTDGTSLSLPSLSAQEQEHVQNLFGSISATDMSGVHTASKQLAAAIYAAVQATPTSGVASTFSTNTTSADDSDDDDDDDGDDDSSWTTPTSQPPLQLQQSSSSLTDQVLAGQGSAVLSPANSSQTSATNTMLAQTSTTAGSTASTSAGSTSASAVTASGTSTASGATQASSTATTTAAAGSTAASTSAASTTTTTGSTGASTSAAPTTTATGTVTASTSQSVSQANVSGSSLTAAVANAATAYTTASGNGDYDQSVQAVTYMGILGVQSDLASYAQQVQGQLNQQNGVRQQLASVTSAIADWPPGQTTQSITYTSYDANGNPTTQTQNLTLSEAQGVQQDLDNTLQGLDDQSQLSQLNLQNLAQNYQQGISTLSNLMKMSYDTVKSVINNIRSS